MNSEVRVALGDRSYDIHLEKRLDGVGEFARGRSSASLALIVTDEHVQQHASEVCASLANADFRVEQVTLPSGEEQKCLATAERLYDRLVDLRADRRTLVVAVGGGVIGDLAGFVAATYNRGLAFLQVPTTLLAMVDSSVGGKVGINHRRGKNLIGAFHQPVGVWIASNVLKTLPEREYRSGLAEVVKYGMILAPQLFDWLEQQVAAVLAREPEPLRWMIARCCRLKADIVEQDERELTGRRAVLNYGHTFAHAFEAVAGYGQWLHGEAVAAGMDCAARLARRLNLIEDNLVERQRRLLQAYSLPTRPDSWNISELLRVMRLDKKAESGRLRFILPYRVGEVRLVEQISEEDVRAVLLEVGCVDA